MKIDLKKLSSVSSKTLVFSDTLDLSEQSLYGVCPFRTPVKISGEITNHLGVMRFCGTIKAIYSTACARCLKPLDILLTAEADAILTSEADADPESEDIYVLTDDCVDPADILVPALILQVDMTYLCAQDCKGLCPHCGVDKNVQHCHCEQKQVDPRFAALCALLDDDKQ